MTQRNVFGVHEKHTLHQLADVKKKALKVALMADGHLGYIMPIGGVAAYNNKVSVVGVGYDIACGNAAIKTDLKINSFGKKELHDIATEIQHTISFGIGRTNKALDAPIDDPLFGDAAWDAIPAKHGDRVALWAKAQNQLGTVGSGNHYVDVFADEAGTVWIGVHFGSRGLGHTIASGFLALGSGGEWSDRVKEQEVILDLATPLGDAYWSAMKLAGQYAYVGREWVARKVMHILGGKEIELVHNHHNYAWKEMHIVPVTPGENPDRLLANLEEREVVVVRKGATPAFPGQKGFVGGSMGDNAVILEGTVTQDHGIRTLQENALYSTVHGAGRVMGRQDAKRGRAARDDDGKLIAGVPRDTSTIITREMQQDWLQAAGVILRGGDVDEAPQAYRRLPDVLEAQGSTIQVLHTLSPVIVVMAGTDVQDPYKD